MQAHAFPAAQGWLWLKAGFALWRRSPLALTAGSISLLMALLLCMMLPWVGLYVPPLLLLPLGVGMFLLCREVAAQRPATPGLLYQGFRRHLPALLLTGSLRVLCQLACFWLAGQIVGVDSATPLMSIAADGQTMSLSPDLLPFMSCGLLLSLPCEMLFWFSPQLIALADVPPLKALFFSAVACWRNRNAIMLCQVLWAVLFGCVPALVVGLIGSIAPSLGSLLSAPMALLLMPMFYTAFHACACDIFGEALAG